MRPFFKLITAGCYVLLLTGCVFEKPPLTPSRTAPRQATIPKMPQADQPIKTPSDTPSPRAMASLELSKRGQLLIEANKPDEAIRYLERAINLFPGRGENYYYLAEAWLLKGNPSQASEYNTLANIHFKENPEWIGRIAFQKNIINQLRKK